MTKLRLCPEILTGIRPEILAGDCSMMRLERVMAVPAPDLPRPEAEKPLAPAEARKKIEELERRLAEANSRELKLTAERSRLVARLVFLEKAQENLARVLELFIPAGKGFYRSMCVGADDLDGFRRVAAARGPESPLPPGDWRTLG